MTKDTEDADKISLVDSYLLYCILSHHLKLRPFKLRNSGLTNISIHYRFYLLGSSPVANESEGPGNDTTNPSPLDEACTVLSSRLSSIY